MAVLFRDSIFFIRNSGELMAFLSLTKLEEMPKLQQSHSQQLCLSCTS